MTLNSRTFFTDTLIKAYHYIVHADGRIDDKEVELGQKMIVEEKIPPDVFSQKMAVLDNEKPEELIKTLKVDLKKLSQKDQIKIIAYMSNIANADGFMDPTEWRMIYQLYKDELNLNLDDILTQQKKIPPFV